MSDVAGVLAKDDDGLLSLANSVQLPQELVGVVFIEVALRAVPEESETGEA